MKMVIDRAIVEQALEALDKLYLPGELERVNAAITALRAALAQQDEPVGKTCTYKCEAWPECGCAPPQRKN